jgi:hypothetical protein
MNRATTKKAIHTLLDTQSSEPLYSSLDSYKAKQIIGPLFSALCSTSEKIRWNAICAFGHTVSKLSDHDIEAARIVMRRFLWSLNDESGGVGWGAPEAMAEIMCENEGLRNEYVHMLISYMRGDGEEEFQDGNFLELPMLQRGLLWGIGRLCEDHCDEMMGHGVLGDLGPYLGSEDQYVVGLAMRALTFLPGPVPLQQTKEYLDSTTVLHLYIDGQMVDVQISVLAKKLHEKFGRARIFHQ